MLAGVPGASSSMALAGVSAQTVPGNVAQSWGGAVPQNPVDVVVLNVPFAGTWPDVQPFRLRIAERPGSVPTLAPDAPANAYEESFSDAGQPQWDPVNRVLTVFLGKGQTATVTYSCYLNISDVLALQTPKPVPQLGYLRWWADPNDGSAVRSDQQVTALAQFTALGVNWHVTPYRKLVLTHAVQQPLFPPVIAPFLAPDPGGGGLPREELPQVAATLGDPSVRLSFGARFNSRTTGKLDLFAQWTEPVDDPAIAPQQPLDGSNGSK